MSSNDGEQSSKKFSFGGAWDNTYGFVKPVVRWLAKPVAYTALVTAAVLGVQNRNEVKGSVRQEIPTVKAILVKTPTDLEPLNKQIDDNTAEWLPEITEASILICNDVSANGGECRTDTVYYSKDDVAKKRVKIDGDNITIQQPLLETNQIRPWIRVSKER